MVSVCSTLHLGQGTVCVCVCACACSPPHLGQGTVCVYVCEQGGSVKCEWCGRESDCIVYCRW